MASSTSSKSQSRLAHSAAAAQTYNNLQAGTYQFSVYPSGGDSSEAAMSQVCLTWSRLATSAGDFCMPHGEEPMLSRPCIRGHDTECARVFKHVH